MPCDRRSASAIRRSVASFNVGSSPWNVNGAVFAGTLGLAAAKWGPVTLFAYVTPFVSVVMIRAYLLRKNQLATDAEADEAYASRPAEPNKSPGLA